MIKAWGFFHSLLVEVSVFLLKGAQGEGVIFLVFFPLRNMGGGLRSEGRGTLGVSIWFSLRKNKTKMARKTAKMAKRPNCEKHEQRGKKRNQIFPMRRKIHNTMTISATSDFSMNFYSSGKL